MKSTGKFDSTPDAQVFDASDGPTPCDKCGKPEGEWVKLRVQTDPTGEEVTGWWFRCPCGREILKVND